MLPQCWNLQSQENLNLFLLYLIWSNKSTALPLQTRPFCCIGSQKWLLAINWLFPNVVDWYHDKKISTKPESQEDFTTNEISLKDSPCLRRFPPAFEDSPLLSKIPPTTAGDHPMTHRAPVSGPKLITTRQLGYFPYHANTTNNSK